MQNSDPSTGTPAENKAQESADLQSIVRTLRNALLLTIAALLLLTGTFCIYLYREVILIRRQTDELARIVIDYQKSALPQLQDFKSKLHEFAKTNSNFAPILGKFFGTNASITLPSVNSIPSLPSQLGTP